MCMWDYVQRLKTEQLTQNCILILVHKYRKSRCHFLISGTIFTNKVETLRPLPHPSPPLYKSEKNMRSTGSHRTLSGAPKTLKKRHGL